MGNCLITNLASVVNNDDLVKVNTILLHASTVSTSDNTARKLRITTTGTVIVKTTGGANVMIDGGSGFSSSLTLSQADTYTLIFKNDTFDIEIENRYNISKMQFLGGLYGMMPLFKIHLNEIECSNITEVVIGQSDSVGDIAAAIKPTTTKFAARNLNTLPNHIYGNICCMEGNTSIVEFDVCYRADVEGDLSYLSALANLEKLGIEGSSITGKIESIYPLTKLNLIELNNLIACTSVEDFVSGQIQNGRTTEADGIKFRALLSRLTFGGNNYPNLLAQMLVWESASKITVYVGNSYSKENATNIYAKGATPEEIAAWQASGKSVTDVVSGTVYPPAN